MQLIYALYLQGCGQKEIARRLNCLGRKTPAQMQAERCGRDYFATKKTADGKYIWDYVSVKNILTDESYAGVLTNHKREVRSGKSSPVKEENQYRHEGFYPSIISREDWNSVQILLKAKTRVAASNKPTHRYAGLLTCGACGNVFVPMNRYWNDRLRVEYVCRSYHRGGKALCSSHRVHEEVIDVDVQKYIVSLRESWVAELEQWKQVQITRNKKQPDLQKQIQLLCNTIQKLENEIDEILLCKIMK